MESLEIDIEVLREELKRGWYARGWYNKR
jgi:hypothetical protein